jgi:hypothetical protein
MKKPTRKDLSRSPAGPRRIPTHSEISALAESIWLRRGRPYGIDDEIWLEAERELSRPPSPKFGEGTETGHLVDTGPFADVGRVGSLMGELNELFPGESGRETTSL